MDDDKFKDLLEDEELTALRLAALATKKKNEQNLNESKSTTALPIDSIVTAPNSSSELVSNQIPFFQSDRSAHNSYSWRKQNQSIRRRGGSFPKSQRSNLIVISPVALNEKDSEGKAPPLVLPQHKWCNSGNEDSMSPKTLRRTGPTRFNRHGSDSESSEDESDYEPSDNDSGSNETILQDEPPEHFSHLSPGCDNLSDSVDKKRRLSFPSVDSDIKSDTFDKNEATSVYKSLKSSFYSVPQHLNDGEITFNNSDENKYSNCTAGHAYATKSSDLSEDQVFKQNNSSMGKAEICSNVSTLLSDTAKIWQDMDVNSSNYSKDPESSNQFRMNDGNHKDYVDKRQSSQTATDMHDSRKSLWQRQHSEGFRTESSLYLTENQHNLTDSKTYNDNSDKSLYLSENDLRNELKKRMQEMKSKTTCIENNEMVQNRLYSQYNSSWDRNRQRYSHKNDEVDLSSVNSFGETQALFPQTNKIKQNFNRENDDVEHASNFNRRRSYRSISRERTNHESFSGRDKNRLEYSSDRRRHDRSSSLDRSRNARSSSQDRRRKDRSSSREDKQQERSPSHGKREWCKTSPREKPDCISSQDRNRHDCNSSSESKHGRSTSRERKKFSFSSSRNKLEYNTIDKDRHYAQSREKNSYENNLNRGRSKHTPNSSHDESRREHSISRDRSRHESSRSLDSRSERSSSLEKNRFSSSREGSKDERSSSESERGYKRNSRSAFNVSKFTSKQQENRHSSYVNQKTNVKENESNHDKVQGFNNLPNKIISTLNSEKIKDEELSKLNTKDLSRSVERNRSERSSSSVKTTYKKRFSRSRSSSSESCSSSYSSSSSPSSRPKIRSVPSVIKPVVLKSDTNNRGNLNANKSVGKSISSTTPQSSVHSICTKRNLDIAETNKPSNIKCGRIDGEAKASESKRVPVHMRLGAFPRKRVIQMPKDVEAAFVNSSSSSEEESVIARCRRQNMRIVTNMFGTKNTIDLIQQKHSSDDKPVKRPSPDICKEKFKRVKSHR